MLRVCSFCLLAAASFGPAGVSAAQSGSTTMATFLLSRLAKPSDVAMELEQPCPPLLLGQRSGGPDELIWFTCASSDQVSVTLPAPIADDIRMEAVPGPPAALLGILGLSAGFLGRSRRPAIEAISA